MSKPPRKKREIRDASALQPALFQFDKAGNPHTRVVWAFDKEQRARQLAALRALRAVKFPQGISAAIPGKSLYDNVRPHKDNKSVKFYLTDFKDAYGSVQQDALREKVESIVGKYAKGRDNQEVRRTIADYMDDGAFLHGVDGLPQGNATSPDLLEWYLKDADSMLVFEMVRRRSLGEVATRYLDDLTVSSPDARALGAPFRQTIREIYKNLAPGMEVNHSKSKIHQLGPRQVTITGLSLYPDGRITPTASLLDAANGVFGEMAAKLAHSEEITLDDVSKVAGYNGVLNLAGESSRSQSRLVRNMGKQAHSLIRQLNARVPKF